MYSSHHFENGHILMPDFESRKYYDKRNLIPNHNAKFVYQRGFKHILLTQQKVDVDIFYHDYNYFHEENKIIKSYVLDEGLAIVWEGNTCRNFDKEFQLLQKQQQNQNQYKGKDNYWNLPLLSYQTKVFQIPQVGLKPIIYRVFPSLNNFLIGRYNFVRNIQSHKIISDSISQQHCQISHFKSNNGKIQNYLKKIQRILKTLTPTSSKCRKISNQLWNIIFDFMKPAQKYVLSDLGSRNGTWIYQVGTQICQLQQNFDYQFERQSYSIHVSKIFTSKDSQNQTVVFHNQKANEILEQFKKQVNWNYYQRANKIMIVQDVRKILAKSDQKIQILIFKLKYRDYHEYYLLAVNENFQKKYSIGCKYDIDVNPEEYDSPSLHGKIYVHNGRWMIESFQIKQNGEYRKVWIRLVKDFRYVLKPQKSYKIRLGSMYLLNLQFKNF